MITPNQFENYYDYLRIVLVPFARKIGNMEINNGCIDSSGSKCDQYAKEFQEKGIPLAHGIILYILTKFPPFCYEVRDVVIDGEKKWISPEKWIIDNYFRFKNTIIDVENSF